MEISICASTGFERRCLIIFMCLLFLSSCAIAGKDTWTTPKKLFIPRYYHLFGSLNRQYRQGGTVFTQQHKSAYSVSKSKASVDMQDYYPNAEVSGSYSSSGWSGNCYGGVDGTYIYSAGGEFLPGSILLEDGIARSEVCFMESLANGPGNTVIATLSDFKGYMRASVNSWHGAACTIMFFAEPLLGDTSLPPNNFNTPLFRCNFRIEHGQLQVSPPFELSDFSISVIQDSTGFMVLQAEPVPGLLKNITLPGTDSTTVIQVNHGVGYGVYNPNPTVYDILIPTLSGWGLIILGLIMVVTGAAFIFRWKA